MRVRSPLVDRVCRACGDPLSKRQMYDRCRYCSHSCAAIDAWALNEPTRRRQFERMQAQKRARYAKRIGEKLRNCKTMGDAFRMGVNVGYVQGYQACARRKRAAA